jgi:hypothetical protein
LDCRYQTVHMLAPWAGQSRARDAYLAPARAVDLVEGVGDLAEGAGADGVEQLGTFAAPNALCIKNATIRAKRGAGRSA